MTVDSDPSRDLRISAERDGYNKLSTVVISKTFCERDDSNSRRKEKDVKSHCDISLHWCSRPFGPPHLLWLRIGGDLKIRFLYDGEPPPQKFMQLPDVPAPGIADESFIVDPETRGIANVIVYLRPAAIGGLPIHPQLLQPTDAVSVMTIRGFRFQPHVAFVCVGQSLEIHNQEMFGHNPKIDFLSNTPDNLILRGGDIGRTRILSGTERLPVNVSDSIKPWLSAKLVVNDHPYVGKTNTDGILTMQNIPIGNWTFQAWHETAGYLRNVEVANQRTTWEKGRFQIQINPKLNDFGDVKISPESFRK